jgi:hypothetical protein
MLSREGVFPWFQALVKELDVPVEACDLMPEGRRLRRERWTQR